MLDNRKLIPDLFTALEAIQRTHTDDLDATVLLEEYSKSVEVDLVFRECGQQAMLTNEFLNSVQAFRAHVYRAPTETKPLLLIDFANMVRGR